MAKTPTDQELKTQYPNAKDAQTRKLVYEHDRLKLQIEVLKSKLKDEAGDYLYRIEDQKKRIHRLETERDEMNDEIRELKEKVSKYAHWIADKVTE